jgi:hypothetical protein
VKVITPLTAGLVLLVVGLVLAAAAADPGGGPAWALALAVGMPLAVLAGPALFAVRGYRLDAAADALLVRRPGRETAVPLAGLQAATARPDAFRGTLMKAGSGGYLGLFGWFWSRPLGAFRAWVTDPARGVLLTFPDRRVVVSPDDPAAFIQAVTRLKALPGHR